MDGPVGTDNTNEPRSEDAPATSPRRPGRPSSRAVPDEIAALEEMDIKQLQNRWRDLFKIDPPARIRAAFLRRAIAYRLQERAFGGLKATTRRQLEKIAKSERQGRLSGRDTHDAGGDGRRQSVMRHKRLTLSPGSRLMREWNGKTEVIDVVEGGFVWRGQTSKSLTAVAKAITGGGRWSGPRFFGLHSSQKATQGRRARSAAATQVSASPGDLHKALESAS